MSLGWLLSKLSINKLSDVPPFLASNWHSMAKKSYISGTINDARHGLSKLKATNEIIDTGKLLH